MVRLDYVNYREIFPNRTEFYCAGLCGHRASRLRRSDGFQSGDYFACAWPIGLGVFPIRSRCGAIIPVEWQPGSILNDHWLMYYAHVSMHGMWRTIISLSVFDLLKIGIEPSSLHTVGLMISDVTFAHRLDRM